MNEALNAGAFHALAWNNPPLPCLGTALGIGFGANLNRMFSAGRSHRP